MSTSATARIDLHTHSSRSDGTDTVAQLVGAAAAAGLDAIALTDHDTTAGWEEARQAAREHGVSVVPGIEVTVRHERQSVHLLAYAVDPDPTTRLAVLLSAARESRDGRARRMTELIARDYPITWEDVQQQVDGPGTVVGRPHIADALVARGVVPDRSAAFESILAADSPYYVQHAAPDPREAVSAVLNAGGVPVLAHPAARGRGGNVGPALLEEMIAAGLAGIEVAHREHSDTDRARLRDLARAHDLIVTGGSDYHGVGKPNRLGENLTEPDQLCALLERAESGTETFSP